MKSNKFRCAMCQEIFDKEWSDVKEFKAFGLIPENERKIICDDCSEFTFVTDSPELTKLFEYDPANN